MVGSKAERKGISLPARVFLYTLDQIAASLSLEMSEVHDEYVYFQGRSYGVHKPDKLMARNIAPDGESPDWRVAEEELVRFLKHKGYKVSNRFLVF